MNGWPHQGHFLSLTCFGVFGFNSTERAGVSVPAIVSVRQSRAGAGAGAGSGDAEFLPER